MKPTHRNRLNSLWPCLLLIGLFAALPTAAAAADAEFTIEARDFDGGNARVSLTGQPYADGPSCIWNAGELPNRAEYEIEFPVTADYTLSGLVRRRAGPAGRDQPGRQEGPHRVQGRDGQLEHVVGQVGGAMHAAHHPRHAHHHAALRGPLSAHLRAAAEVVRAVSRRLATAAAHPGAAGRAGADQRPTGADQGQDRGAGRHRPGSRAAGDRGHGKGVSRAGTTGRRTGRPWPSSSATGRRC